MTLATYLLDLSDRSVDSFLVCTDIIDDYVEAVSCQSKRDRFADTSGTAGDLWQVSERSQSAVL